MANNPAFDDFLSWSPKPKGKPEPDRFVPDPRGYELYVGIDPGKNGAIAILDGTPNVLDGFNFPRTATKGPVDAGKLYDQCAKLPTGYTLAVLENANAASFKSQHAARSIMESRGQMMAIGASLGWNMDDRYAATWRKQLFGKGNMRTAVAKQAALQYVGEHFPLFTLPWQQYKRHNVAEAVCIGLAALMRYLSAAERRKFNPYYDLMER